MSTADLTAAALRDPALQEAATAELRDFLRRGLARSFGHQLADADLDDLTQDATAQVLLQLDRFGGRSRLSTWAMSIAVNEALQLLRRRRHRALALADAIDRGHRLLAAPDRPADAVERNLARAEQVALLRRGIAAVLSEPQREALLAEIGGLPLAEIAARQRKSRGALYKSLHDARRKLRDYLVERGVRPEDLGGTDA